MDQEEFAKAIVGYWNHKKLERPQEHSLNRLVPSAHNYVDQRVVNRNKDKEVRSSELSKLVKKVETLHGNLNYKKSVADWETFYTFPEPSNAVQYAREENIHANRIVNFNSQAPKSMADEIVDDLDVGDYQGPHHRLSRGHRGNQRRGSDDLHHAGHVVGEVTCPPKLPSV